MLWYVLVWLGTLLEGELTMTLSGFGVYRQSLSMAGVVTAAFLGSFMGDWLFFELGRRRGSSWLQRYPTLAQRAAKVAAFLAKWPVAILFILRFQIGMRMIGNLTLGMGSLARGRYLFLNAIACLTWSIIVSVVCLFFARIMTAVWSAIPGG